MTATLIEPVDLGKDQPPIVHTVVCENPNCHGCPDDDIAVCGVDLSGDFWQGGEPGIKCVVCQDLQGAPSGK